jgi:hypothetical protein
MMVPTVTYAGTISNHPPPAVPTAFATGLLGNPSAAQMEWSANDAELGVTTYHYAIGTKPEV